MRVRKNWLKNKRKKKRFNLFHRFPAPSGAVFVRREVIVNKMGFTKVSTANGQTKTRMWAEFRYEIGGRNIMFRVTSSTSGPFTFVLTHVASGMRVDDITWRDVAFTRYNAGRNNYGAAGAKALKRRMDEVGVKRFIAATHRYPNA